MNSSFKKKNRVKLYNPYRIILKDNHKTKNYSYSCFTEITKDILAAFGIIPVTDTHLDAELKCILNISYLAFFH